MTNKLLTMFIAAMLMSASSVYSHSNNETLPPTQPADPRMCEEYQYEYTGNFAIALACFGKLITTGSVSGSVVPEPTPGAVFYFDDWNTGSDYQVPN